MKDFSLPGDYRDSDGGNGVDVARGTFINGDYAAGDGSGSVEAARNSD